MFFASPGRKCLPVEKGLKWTKPQSEYMDIFAINNGGKCCRTAFHNGSENRKVFFKEMLDDANFNKNSLYSNFY